MANDFYGTETEIKNMDPQVAEYLRTVRSLPPAHLLPIEQLRKDIDRLRDFYPPEPVEKITNIDIPGPAGKIPVRVYTPAAKGALPAHRFDSP